MATSREKPEADDDPARFRPNDELTENSENDEKLITLELQWPKTAQKTERNFEKSLKKCLQTKNKDLKFSDLKIQKDNNALIKVEHSSDAEILEKLSGKDLTLEGGTTVTVKNVILGSLKKNAQTADDASMTSTPSTSDDKGQMNGQRDQDSSPEQSSRDEKKKTKSGDVPDKHTHSSKSDTSDQTGQKDKVDQGFGTPSAIQEESKENVASKKKEPESVGNPAAEHLENPENDGKLITLELQWPKTVKKADKCLEESLKKCLQTKNKDLKFSDLKIQKDNNALIKVEHSSDAEILEKLSGKDLTLEGGTTVTVKDVILGSLKKNAQTADDASMTSNASTSDDKGQMNSKRDEDFVSGKRSRDARKNPKDGNVPEKHTEKSGKLILLLKWSDSAKKDQNDLEKSLKSWSKRECKRLPISVVKILEDNKAVIKTEPNAAANIVQKLTGEKLHLKYFETVTVESVILDSAKVNIQTPTTPSTSDEKGQTNGQKHQDSRPEKSSSSKFELWDKGHMKILNVPDKHTHLSNNCTDQNTQTYKIDPGAATSSVIQEVKNRNDEADDGAACFVSKEPLHLSNSHTSSQTSQTNKVAHGAGTSSDFSRGSAKNPSTNRKEDKAGDNQADSLSKAKCSKKGQDNVQRDQDSGPEQNSKDEKKKTKDGDVPDKHTDKAEVDEALIILMLKWSKQPTKQQTFLQKSLQTWFSKRESGLSCSVVKILENKNALINITPSPAMNIFQKLSGENLRLQDDTTVTVESVVLGSPELNTGTADDASMTSTPSTLDGKGQVSGQNGGQNDRDSAEGSSPDKQIRQNQEDSVPVPVGFFWYLSQVHREEIKRIEKENCCEMKVTLNVAFEAKQKDGSQKKALSEFTNLVQNRFNESSQSVIPVQNVRSEQCSEAFKLIQNNKKKVLLTLTPTEITVCGPDSAQLKSVLERNTPDEKPHLLRDVTPLKMTINDPLADAGMKMEESTWKTLNAAADGKITKIKEKFDVDFQEIRRDGGKVQVKAFSNGSEGNPCMESNAVRALLRLYQRSVTSSLNFIQFQGASGFRERMDEDESEKRSVPEGGATGGDSSEENCSICLSPFTDKKRLQCKHEFCELCLQRALESNGAICPICRKVFGIIQGDQPDGSMSFTKSSGQVPGFSNCGTITITYTIPSGTQTEKHPKPGHWYPGTTRTAYLPDNREGNEVLNLLKRAFDQKLIFTIGASRTTGCENQVTWNDIHHKTSLYGGPDGYGYPDPNYLSRVRAELKAKGIE